MTDWGISLSVRLMAHFCGFGKMFLRMLVLPLLAFIVVAENVRNSKRSISSLGLPSWNPVLGHTWPLHHPWQANPDIHGSLHPFITQRKVGHFGLGTSATHDVAAAVAAAKEATAAAALAHQKVQAAREQVVIQERVAAAKEAAAHAAIQRSEAAAQVAAAIQKSEALAAAAAAVQKSAAASVASASAAAHAAGHFISVPWINSKPAFHHWG